jgi:hypothetical protein
MAVARLGNPANGKYRLSRRRLRKLEIFVPADSGSLFASQQKDITRRFSGRLRCGFSRLASVADEWP